MSVRIASASQIKIPVKKGALSGYHISNSSKMRRAILHYYASKDGFGTVIKRLNTLATFNKHHPDKYKILESDIKWLHNLVKQIHKFLDSQK